MRKISIALVDTWTHGNSVYNITIQTNVQTKYLKLPIEGNKENKQIYIPMHKNKKMKMDKQTN